MDRTFTRRGLPLLVALAAGACGGGGEPATATATLDPLFAEDGQPSAAARQRPAAGAPVTRAGLYATPEQLAWSELVARPYTVVVEVDRHASPDEAVELALRNLRFSGEAGRQAAFFVRAADAARAAWVADELAASGAPSVFVVVEAGA